MSLEQYWEKRNFDITPEPHGKKVLSKDRPRFFIQKHAARRLHYDFRLELEGTLKSWAIPKGPSLDPADKRLAVQVEDHPVEYGTFEGDIPARQYGAGHVMLWEQGTWEAIDDPIKGLKNGYLKFRLHGQKLHGTWTLIRINSKKAKDPKINWLLIKENDEEAKRGVDADVTRLYPDSVKKKSDLKQLASSPHKKPTPIPHSFSPQLATLVSKAPLGEEWISELKYDGYRALAKIDHGKVTLFSRNNNDWTKKWNSIAHALKAIEVEQAWLDGEIVALLPDGSISFQELQNAARLGKDVQLAYFIFDMLFLNGSDLTKEALIQRKGLLKKLLGSLESNSPLRYSDHIVGNAPEVFDHACMHGLEGIIVKRAEGEYHQYRSTDWLKVKCDHRQEFVIGGYTDPKGTRNEFGALLLGVYDAEGALRYTGRVGTGFNSALIKDISSKFNKLKKSTSPFESIPEEALGTGIHWLKPELVAEIKFAQWTAAGVIRHASFIGLHTDKPSVEIRKEERLSLTELDAPKKEVTSQDTIGNVKLTNPSKVLFSGSKTTKSQLARYYEDIQEWILPHLQYRPLSIVRCPSGNEKNCFFQKHIDISSRSHIEHLVIASKNGESTYTLINDLTGLIQLIQLGVLELHTWGSSKWDINKADRLIFDLDPADDLPWRKTTEAAMLVRSLLEEIGLQSFVKTTGGKGLHIVAPIIPEHDWTTIKAFAKSIATHLENTIPDRFTANMSKEKRKGKIFVDYLRNGHGATAIAAYSTRAKPYAPISTPLFWDELGEEIRSDTFTITNIRNRLSSLKEDPWKDYPLLKQHISPDIGRVFP